MLPEEFQISKLHNDLAIPVEIEKIFDQIVINSKSRSCIIMGKPCTGKTKLISSYFQKKKTGSIPNELIVIHINCLNYDDNTLLSILLERINEQFPMHRRLFSGHQKISILKEKLFGLSKCGYTIVFILDNCEPVVIGTSNDTQPNSNIIGHSSRQFALYTLVDIMHSPEINLVLILSTSMFDLPDFFEKRVKSRMSQRRIILEELINPKGENKIKNMIFKASELLKIDKKLFPDTECLRIDSYNDSISNLFNHLIDENKQSMGIMNAWEFLFDFEMENEVLSNFLYQFLLVTPQCNIKEFTKIFLFEYKKGNIQRNKSEFQLLSQGIKVQECIRLKRFESLSVIQHTILVAFIKLITLGTKNITFKKIANEITSLRNYISVQSSLSGLNLDHTEESYNSSFLMLVKMGIIEPAYVKTGVSYHSMSTTPVKFTQYKLYSDSIKRFNIPTILQYWLKNNILK